MTPWSGLLRRDPLGSQADRATFRTLHTASLAAPPLRGGLTEAAAQRSLKFLRALLGAPAVAMTDTSRLLAWDGARSGHGTRSLRLAETTLRNGRTVVASRAEIDCDDPGCPLREGIVAPLVVEEKVVGTLQVFALQASAVLVQASDEVARWVSGQLELAELDASRTRLIEAEVRALRAQISPHFIYNSLTAIASFTRTDPGRARELLLDLAEFTRYSFRRHGEFTTLAEELRSIEAYLVIEKARFGDRLVVTVRVAPEVLPVVVPFLCLQPLVENAVRHGIEGRPGQGEITILAQDADRECVVTIEDNGIGEDPERVRRALTGDTALDSVGLANVDERLRTAFGDEYGLVVETAPGAGTCVTVRLPKFRPGVHV
ncbi:histidine kinase [Intrasporangium sp.]|uniref:sensor histidine kinase n=1 Tax=Intrasporangium sp. TaxID=1925024 RepID=UPI0032215AAD